MVEYEIRPLSLGELLDRSFALYRNHFRLFLGISIFPHLVALVWHLLQVWTITLPSIRSRAAGQAPALGVGGSLLVLLSAAVAEYFFVYLFTQAPTTYAVAQIYLGRPITAGAALRQTWTNIWSLTGCVLLTGPVLLIGMLLLVPGITLLTRLLVALPAATIENASPTRAFRRSFQLTRDHSGRSLLIFLLYFMLRLAAYLLLFYPTRIAHDFVSQHGGAGAVWLELVQLGSVAEATLIGPILTIAASVFYFDLRMRKEALDLRLMLDGERGLLPEAN